MERVSRLHCPRQCYGSRGGVIIGAAFGKIVTTLVEGILMPPIGLLLGSVDFSSLFAVLDASKGFPASLADAKAKGIPVIAYGQFLNDIIGFLIVALAVFVIVKQVNRIKRAVDKPVVADAVPRSVSSARRRFRSRRRVARTARQNWDPLAFGASTREGLTERPEIDIWARLSFFPFASAAIPACGRRAGVAGDSASAGVCHGPDVGVDRHHQHAIAVARGG